MSSVDDNIEANGGGVLQVFMSGRWWDAHEVDLGIKSTLFGPTAGFWIRVNGSGMLPRKVYYKDMGKTWRKYL